MEKITLPPISVLLITGIMASGKSTVAQHIAERLPKSVHLRGDVFRRMIVNDRASLQADMSARDFEQLRLRYRISASVAALYCQAGFTVVYQDIILGPMLKEVIDLLSPLPLGVVVLCPSAEVAAQRDAAREKTGYTSWTAEMLDHELRTNTPRFGLWLDTSLMTVEETVDTILAQLDKAKAKLGSDDQS